MKIPSCLNTVDDANGVALETCEFLSPENEENFSRYALARPRFVARKQRGEPCCASR